MKKNSRWTYAVISAVMLWLAWPPMQLAPLLFIALVPLFLAEEELFESNDPKSGRKLFGTTFFSFTLWNLLSTYWIWNASAVGMVVAVLLNAFLMSLPFWAYHKMRHYYRQTFCLLMFISFWIAYEYFHMQWDLSWPWLTLGNGFAEQTKWVQWYEYTGVFGGSLWILLINVIAFKAIQAFRVSASKTGRFRLAFAALALVIAPVLISLSIYSRYEEQSNPCNIVVVQPNIDPYNEKFSDMPAEAQLEKLIRLSDSVAQKNTEFFIWPETALQGSLFENDLESDPMIGLIHSFLSKYKHGNLVTGASTYLQYDSKKTATARKFSNGQCCYDAFNTALFIENDPGIRVYHKSKLVAGVEQMPYPQLFSFLEPLALNLGGTVGSLGKQDERTVFYTKSGIGVAPVICYESVYGEFLAKYIMNGAQFIAIVTNDGWWGNTQGYKQHASYARLRAIETRRSIARSANTGISSFIDQRGDVIAQTSWWQPTALKQDINLNDSITFYVVYGDWIAKVASALAGIGILLLVIRRFRP